MDPNHLYWLFIIRHWWYGWYGGKNDANLLI